MTRGVAVGVGRSVGWLSRRLGTGGGTSLPGLVAERIDPRLLADLGAQIPNGLVVVSGTNGKTTTSRILSGALRKAGLVPITNRAGSNLTRGLATTLLGHADVRGRLNVPDNAIGVFEVDEGDLPRVLQSVRPRSIVLTNLFRDQLDRYFEVDFIATLWLRALEQLSDGVTLVLNADDPQVAYLGKGTELPVLYFGIEDPRVGREGAEHTSDARRCLRCEVDLAYSSTYYSHLGHYACQRCGWRRPRPRVGAWRVDLDGLDGSAVVAATPWGDQELTVRLAGMHNVYNVLAAAAAAFSLGVDAASVRDAVAESQPAFGRLERFTVRGRDVCLALVKNPTGFNQMLRLLVAGEDRASGLLLALNDNGPDGRDVSWIWDVDLELCRGRGSSITVSGLRAQDLALRLKLAGCLDEEAIAAGRAAPVIVEPDIVAAFWQALDRVPPGERLCILPTYTAMWTLRTELARLGSVQPFWQQ